MWTETPTCRLLATLALGPHTQLCPSCSVPIPSSEAHRHWGQGYKKAQARHSGGVDLVVVRPGTMQKQL